MNKKIKTIAVIKKAVRQPEKPKATIKKISKAKP